MKHGPDHCCFRCMDLKRGSFALSITFTVLHSLEACLLIGFLATARTVLQGIEHDAEELEHMLFLMHAIGGVLLTVTLLSVAFDVLLIFAVRNRRPVLVLAWVVWTGILLGLDTVAQCLETISLIALSVTYIEIVVSVLLLAYMALQWYWLVVIISYYKLARGQRQQFQMQRFHPDESVQPKDSRMAAEEGATA